MGQGGELHLEGLLVPAQGRRRGRPPPGPGQGRFPVLLGTVGAVLERLAPLPAHELLVVVVWVVWVVWVCESVAGVGSSSR